jgi:hypothetical protein
MKTFTLLAVTGGLFFTSLCLNSKDVKSTKDVKNAKVCLKNDAGHSIKKNCNNAKKAKTGSTHISKRAVSAHS